MADIYDDTYHDLYGFIEASLAWPVAGDPHRLMTIEYPDRRKLRKKGTIRPKGNA